MQLRASMLAWTALRHAKRCGQTLRPKVWPSRERTTPSEPRAPRGQGRSSNPSSVINGLCAWSRWQSLRWLLWRMAAYALCQSALRRSTTTGWRTSRTGASAASCGGAIASLCGMSSLMQPLHRHHRRETVMCTWWHAMRLRRMRRHAQHILRWRPRSHWSRTKMFWTLGSHRGCGPSVPWAGQMWRPQTSSSSIPHRSWRLAMISSSSGCLA
mmetsp:Transcript_16175/g.44205  ORF Transcript_16175/g.44205 Transcript_16175/m.44205 type:complete len:213 (+) Transcript_16175:4056-4694(+)